MAYSYHHSKSVHGPCDSSFTESEDNDIYAQRAHAREQARFIASQRQRTIAEDLSNGLAAEYQEDILDHMEQMESDTIPDVNSIDIQTEIQWFMRPYLLDFLIEAHAAFQLLPETLYLTINILDRYCSKRVVYKRHYQLVGCAALLVASKYGDKKERVPTVRELKSMCCSLYEDEMFTQMEWHVLVTLGWLIGHPTVDSFLQLALAEGPQDVEVEHMTWFICEIALYHKEFVSTLPSTLARSALALARCILERTPEKQTEWSSRYDSLTVINLSQRLSAQSQVLSKKYAAPHLSCVSHTLEAFLRRQAQISQQQHLSPETPPVSQGPFDGSTSAATRAMPHTPQKGPVPSHVAYGYMTPPITPDSEQQYIAQSQAKYHQTTAAIYNTSNLTPPSSAEPAQIEQYHRYTYAQPPPPGPQFYVQSTGRM